MSQKLYSPYQHMDSPDPTDMDLLLRLMRGRRSVRRLRDEPLQEATLTQLLEAARWAPSAGNRQAYRLLVVTSSPALVEMGRAVRQAAARVSAAARQDQAAGLESYLENFCHFATAPAVIVPIYRAGADLLGPAAEEGRREAAVSRAVVDSLSSVSAAVMNLLLAAHALGLGACWMTGPLIAAEELRRILRVPRGWDLAALIPVGVPAEEPDAPRRRDLKRLARWIQAPEEDR